MMGKQTHRKDHPKTMSLLQALRNKLVEETIINPITDRDAEQKMNLILRHQSEFPLKLRASIREAEGNPRKSPLMLESLSRQGISRVRRRLARNVEPKEFLHEVYEAVKVFFLGILYRAVDADQHQHWLLGWHGLDHDVDTEDEAELVIRCFPKILTQTTHLARTGLHRAFPIHMLLSDSKTVSFVPLFCQLGVEVGLFHKEEKGGLACSNMSVVSQLLCNKIASTAEASRAQYKGLAPNTDKVDQESLDVLMRLREQGLVTKQDNIQWFELIIDLFDAASYRETAFVEKRLQFLIDWNPDLLVECDAKLGYNLLYASCVWNGFRKRRRFCGAEIRIFEVIFERGMLYFPLQVGFLFHKGIFRLGCQGMGKKKVKEMVRDKLLRALGQTSSHQDEKIKSTKKVTLQTLVIAAAANEAISLDGVYTLIRFDPTIALMPQCSHNTRCCSQGFEKQQSPVRNSMNT